MKTMKTKFIILFTLLFALTLSAQTMHEAIKSNNLKQLITLIETDRSLLNTSYKIEQPLPIMFMPEEITPLFDAILFGRFEMVKYMVEAGVDLKSNNYALFLALLQKEKRTKNLLIKNGARFVNDTATHMRCNILTTAVFFYPDLSIVQEVINLGGGLEEDWGKDGNYTHTPLGMATRHMKLDIARLLIKHGAKLNYPRNYGQIGLHDAIFYGNKPGEIHKGFSTELLELLLKNGGNKRHRDDNGNIPVEHAAQEGVLPALKMLWDDTYDINFCDTLGMTLLHKTTIRGYLDCVEFLLAKGFKLNQKDELGNTPLDYAYKHGHKQLIEFLLSKGATNSKKNL